jgi:hypothetical protein
MNDELRRIYDADQADRAGNHPTPGCWERDAERRARVAEILAAGGAVTADDWFHAAMVYQHGGTAELSRRARELAQRAIAVDPTHNRARWLIAAATDRELVQLGRPQRYGTQFFVDNAGRWSLQPVDPAVTDEERAAWNVPPLAAALQRVRDENGKKTD